MTGQREAKRDGFTLIELLVVMAIMSIMIGGSVAAFNALSSNQSLSQISSTIQGVLENARTIAMAHNTYVWVGFSSGAGNSGLEIMAVESKTGQSIDLAQPADLTPIMKPRFISNVNLNTTVSITGMSASSVNISSTASSATFSAKVAGGNMIFPQLIQFSPQDEVIVPGNNLTPWVNVGLSPQHGKPTNVAALQISGTTGDVRLFQP